MDADVSRDHGDFRVRSRDAAALLIAGGSFMIARCGTRERPLKRYDAIMIGGGLVGSAIAYGLGRSGLDTALG